MITIDYNTRKVLAGKLWQYDYGQVLRIQGGNLNKVQEIQFALEETGADAMPRFGVTKDGVTDVVIPDVMLENNDFEVDYPFYVFIYNRDDASGETVEKFALNVLARSKPENFTAPEDTKLFQEAIKTVNESAERAESAEQKAAQHAEQTKADAIKTGEDRTAIAEMVESVSGIGEQVQAVKEYKDQAQTAATNALLSEQKSERAKELTLQAQAQAETAANEAEQHVLEVAGDKSEVERLATQVRQDKSSVEQTKTAVDKTAQDFTLTAQQALADVNNAGQTQSERVQQVGQDAIADVNTAKTQAVETVNATKTDAVKAVQKEGTKQTEAVQAKGQEVINSIPEDFPTQMQSKLDKQQGVEHAGKSLIIGEDGTVIVGEPAIQIEVDKTLTQEGQAADAKATGDKILQYAIKATASGESIVLTDSAEEKLQDIKLFGKSEQLSTTGKNLFDIDEFLKLPLEQFSNYGNARVLIITLKPNTAYTMHTDNTGSLTGEVDVSRSLYFTSVDDMMLDGNTTGVFKGHNITKTSDETGKLKIVLIDRKNAIPIVNKEKYVMLAEGSTALPYEPYTGGKPSPSVEYPQEIINAGENRQIEVKVTGKNLFDISKLKSRFDGVKIDGNKITLPIGGAIYFTSIKNICPDLKVGDEVYIFADSTSANKNVYLYPQSGLMPLGNKITIKSLDDQLLLYGDNSKISTITNLMFTKVNDKTYETYKEPQTLTIQLDRPITKWDKIEKRDGVWGVAYKSKEVVFNGSEDEVWRNQTDSSGNTQFYTDLKDCPIKHVSDFVDNFYCDKFTKSSKAGGDIAIGEVRYGSLGAAFAPVFKPKHEVGTLLLWRDLLKENPITILYETNSEEFVPLPEETQTVLNALHTNYPATVITNSEDCEMEVEYVADTKNYIDNKISANVASIISQYQTNVANLLSLMPLSVQAGMVENDTNNILENVEVTK